MVMVRLVRLVVAVGNHQHSAADGLHFFKPRGVVDKMTDRRLCPTTIKQLPCDGKRREKKFKILQVADDDDKSNALVKKF